MAKIIKLTLIYVLAFFILEAGIFSSILNAQDTETLENGLRIIIKEDHANPIVVFSVFIDIGSASETPRGSGVSHLLEHMLFKGTKKYPTGTIETILDKYGGNIDAFTSYDYTGYRITILKEHYNIALDILKEMLTSPTLDAKELTKEMEVIKREMRLNKDDPGRRISRLAFSSAYTRHPYRLPIIGYEENFKRLDRTALLAFFKEQYTPEKIVLAVVGDIDSEALQEEIKDLFGKIPRGENMSQVLPIEPIQIAEKQMEETQDIEGAYLNIAFHSTGLLDHDLYALDLLAFILGQSEGSILNKELRLKKELVLSISSYNYTPKHPGLFIISSALKEENVQNAIDEVMKQLDLLKHQNVSEEDLIRAKNNFLADFIYQKETISSQANDLAIGELLTGNPNFFEVYIANINSVTIANIQRVANKYLIRDNMTVTVLSASGNSLKLAPESVRTKTNRQIEKFTLPNNLTVLLSQNKSLPIISISLLLKGGVRAETEGTNGISRLTSLMLMNGTDLMTRQQITEFYESKGMILSSYSANNSLGITAKCLKEHIEPALKLMSEVSTRSTFPDNELEREKNETRALIDMQDNDIVSHGHRLLKKELFKTHPYRFQTIGTHKSIDPIERSEIAKFYKNLLKTGNMTLGICGDFELDQVKALIEKYFSNIPSGDVEGSSLEKESAIEVKRDLLVNTNKEQTLVLLGFPSIDIYSKDRYALEVIIDLLSGQSGILFKNIRGKKGLAYATGAFEVLGLDPGYIVLYTLTAKENIDKVKKTIDKEVGNLIKKGVTEVDLNRSKNHLKAMRHMSLETNSAFIFMASLDELYGLGYANYKDYEKNIDRLSTKDIKRAAKEFLTLDKCAIVVLEGQ